MTGNLEYIFLHFVLGFSGGFGHCILMCHPFVLHISSTYADAKAGYKILIPNGFYNLGRTVTYTFMGIAIGSIGSIAGAADALSNNNLLIFQKSVAIIGGSVLIIYAIMYFFDASSFNLFTKLPIVNKLKKINPKNPFVYGIVLGFLPCGLTMGALLGTISSGSWYMGGAMMAAFGFGTAFAMMVLAIFGSYVMRYVKYFKHITTVLLFIMGIYFIYQGIVFSY